MRQRPKNKTTAAKHELFCQEYLKDLNAAAAAERAGYSKHTARHQGSYLLTDPDIKSRINELKAERNKRVQIEADDVLKELIKIGFCDIRSIFDENGNVKDPSDWDENTAKCVASIEVLEEFQGYGKDREFIGYTKKVKFWDKTKCLELIGKHKKMFTDVLDVNVKTDLADRLAKARQRVGKK